MGAVPGDEQFARARECFDRVIARSDEIDPRYRRALCELALDDFTAAAADLEEALTEGLVKLQEKIQQEKWLVRRSEPAGVRA